MLGKRGLDPVYLVPGQVRSPLHHIPVGLDGLEPPVLMLPEDERYLLRHNP